MDHTQHHILPLYAHMENPKLNMSCLKGWIIPSIRVVMGYNNLLWSFEITPDMYGDKIDKIKGL